MAEQINCTEVARLYGGEATYSAIENFLRKPKKQAQKLKAEAVDRKAPAASPAKKGVNKKNREGNVSPKKSSECYFLQLLGTCV